MKLCYYTESDLLDYCFSLALQAKFSCTKTWNTVEKKKTTIYYTSSIYTIIIKTVTLCYAP